MLQILFLQRLQLTFETILLALPLSESPSECELPWVFEVRGVIDPVLEDLPQFDPLPPSIEARWHHLDSWVTVAQ
jgi:hypothetical protein